MAWINPKTNWTSASFVNASDYNRIINNIAYIKAYADDLFANLSDVLLGENKTYLSLIYANEINAIETAISTLNLETYNIDIGDTRLYMPNEHTPDYNELNRIENATLRLYETMVLHKANLIKLDFKLGNQKGLKV